MNESTGSRVRFRDVLGVRPFRALWLSQIQSLAGDQLARVALSVLVFSRTGSASLTALTYALTFVPAILGGVLLGGLADRYPRRQVMIICDLARASMVAVMALPGLPLWLLGTLVAVVVVVGQPFLAAEAAILPSLLEGELFVVGSGLRMLTSQLAQVIGFAMGGLVVALLGVRVGLAIDAATFFVSVALVARFVPSTAAAPSDAHGRFLFSDAASAIRFIWQDQRLRLLLGLAWLAAFHVVPEALAAPYAAHLGGGAKSVGLLMAAPPAGMALGAMLIVRIPDRHRDRSIGALAAVCAVPLAACALHPGLAVSLVLWFLLGVFTAYQVLVSISVVRAVPDERRGQVLGIDNAGLIGGQGVGALVFGVLAQHMSAAGSVATAGIAAVAIGAALALRYRAIHSANERAEGRALTGASTDGV